jgi:hypothetical protein
MMKWLGLAMLVAGTVFVFAGLAGAHKSASATRIVLDHSSQQGGTNTNLHDFVGHLESSNDRCLARRTVKVILHIANGGTSKLLDTDRTGTDGVWAVGGNTIRANSARFVVTRKTIGGRHHRRICQADSTSVHFV